MSSRKKLKTKLTVSDIHTEHFTWVIVYNHHSILGIRYYYSHFTIEAKSLHVLLLLAEIM